MKQEAWILLLFCALLVGACENDKPEAATKPAPSATATAAPIDSKPAGTTALRFTRGMAGPDLTRGSEGVRKPVAACDSPSWAVATDDNVTWGLAIDLVLAVSSAEDGGTPPKARDVALVAKAVPGQKV